MNLDISIPQSQYIEGLRVNSNSHLSLIWAKSMSNPSDRLSNISLGQPKNTSKAVPNCSVEETYLSHPVFGLLVNLCIIDSQSALYTSLYAKRLFFLVAATDEGLQIDSINRDDARVILEKRLSVLRKSEFHQDHEQLKAIYKSTFSR